MVDAEKVSGGASQFARAWGEHENAFATPSWLGRDGLTGCVHRADGAKAHLSERFGGHLGDHFPGRDPETVPPPGPEARRLTGRSLYLGHLMTGHYGHFVTETLSTFWVFDEVSARDFDHLVFHDFHTRLPLPEFARIAFDAFGLDPARLVVIRDAPVVFDRVLVPERLLRLNHSADPAMVTAHRRIVAHVGADGDERPDRRLYLSRRRLGAARGYANECRLEALFARAGFEIVHPQTMPFAAQLRLYARADALAGVAGSALHNVLFAPAGAVVVEMGDPRHPQRPSPTQALCNAVANARGVFVEFRGRRLFPPRPAMLVDVEHVRRRLGTIFGDGGDPAPAVPPPTVAERAEILGACSRAAVRALRARTPDPLRRLLWAARSAVRPSPK